MAAVGSEWSKAVVGSEWSTAVVVSELSTAVVGDEWSTSRLSCFCPRERAPSTLWRMSH